MHLLPLLADVQTAAASGGLHAKIQELGDWYQAHLASGGYLLIVLLMAMESSIVPIPSELVIPPAAYLAYSTGTMSVPGVVIAGAIGCVVGAVAMYVVSFLAGRPLVLKYGRFVGSPPERVVMGEEWARRYGSAGIFGSRFVPVLRHLIGIPAGITRMHFGKYSLYTFLGSGIWCAVLAYVGIKAGQNENVRNLETKTMTLIVVGAVVVLGAIYYFAVHRTMKKPRTQG